jgi:hypothetical protein
MGLNFLQAARDLCRTYRDEQKFFMPALYLYSNAFELILKSWLRFHGFKMIRLKNEYGHDLWKIYQADRKLKIPTRITSKDGAILKWLSQIHTTHALRYPVEDERLLSLPTIADVETLAQRLEGLTDAYRQDLKSKPLLHIY